MTDPLDMSQFIEARSDQLNADDLLDGPRTITITRVSGTGSAEQPVAVHYEGENGRPFMPCKTVRRLMVGAWGKYTDQYVGRSMTVYRDPEVSFGGMVVGGIRVSHMSHIDGEKTLALQVTRGRKAPFKIKPLKMKVQPADDLSVALQAITDAAAHGTEALSNAWKQKWMAPHREALQLDLDRLKVVAAANDKPSAGPDDEADPGTNDAASYNLGEQLGLDDAPAGSGKVQELKAALAAAKDADAVEAAVAEYEKHKAALDGEMQNSVEIAISQARAKAKAGEGVE